ncbi:Transketolase [Rhizopus stolonifer]|uniref:transketolase n=2 Tax=Mucorineae TaxID=1344963 RepID=A0A367JXN0_RHIST|nr:Transketolase [Rhizopus stolonifer]
MLTIRPADGNEVSGAYWVALTNLTRPSVIALSRQGLPQLEGSAPEKVLKGAYVLKPVKDPKAVLVATGSEVSLAVESAQKLADKGITVQVVSMPCSELFDEQSQEYKLEVFPLNVPVISIECLATFGWERYAHASIGMRTFGSSAKAEDLFKKFKFVPEHVVEKTESVIEHFKKLGYVPQTNVQL